MAALIDGDHRVPARVQGLRHAVPETKIRGQPVDEHEGQRLRVAVAALDVEGDAGSDGHAHLGWRDRAGLAHLLVLLDGGKEWNAVHLGVHCGFAVKSPSTSPIWYARKSPMARLTRPEATPR